MGSSRVIWRGLWGIVAGALVGAGALPAVAQRKEAPPNVLEGVGVTEHADAQIPLDLEFVDTQGKTVKLAEFFDGTRPVILTLNYSACPRLCGVQLGGLVAAMKRMPWNLGEQYQNVTVSFDPLETSDRARLTKQKYLEQYGRPGSSEGWHFLVGRQQNIQKLTDTVGFHYRLVGKQYVHPAVLMICTPDGHISRYIYKVEYDPQTLRFSLYEAGQGRVGSPMDQVLLFCFHYDPESGRYGLAATNLMRAGGVLTLLLLGGVLAVYWLRERRRGRSAKVTGEGGREAGEE
jgi:protein SCO1/2